MLKDLKFICQLDGYNYYLGDVIAADVNWFKAKELVDGLGQGWELPSCKVGNKAHKKGLFEGDYGWLWLGEEDSASNSWQQYMVDGSQHTLSKTYSSNRFVRPVYKEKVV